MPRSSQTTVTPGASTLVVTNTNDSGPGSLRQAIFDANDAGPRDTITFNIPGSGPHTIRPTTRNLPDITQPVVIDGTTQPGLQRHAAHRDQRRERGHRLSGLSSTAATASSAAWRSTGSLASGIVAQRAGGNTIEGNFIGTNPTGTAALPNSGDGIIVRSSRQHDRRDGRRRPGISSPAT